MGGASRAYAQSKANRRVQEAAARAERQTVDSARKDLDKLYEMAQHIRNRAHLDVILGDYPDPVMREAMRKLLEPMIAHRDGVDGESQTALRPVPVLVHE